VPRALWISRHGARPDSKRNMASFFFAQTYSSETTAALKNSSAESFAAIAIAKFTMRVKEGGKAQVNQVRTKAEVYWEDVMKKTYLITAIVALLSVWIMAQSEGQRSTYPNRTSPSKQHVAASDMAPTEGAQTSAEHPHDSLLEGCLGGSRGNLTLTNAAGKVYQLRGDTATLADHIGQQAALTGIVEPGSASPEAGAQPTFNVKKVNTIASTCSAPR
jgi:hypothetical protein